MWLSSNDNSVLKISVVSLRQVVAIVGNKMQTIIPHVLAANLIHKVINTYKRNRLI